MDQSTLNIAAGAVMACLGWFARMLWDRQEAQAKALEAAKESSAKSDAEIRILLAGSYVSNEKFGEVMADVRDNLRYIRDRMDETPQRRQGDTRS